MDTTSGTTSDTASGSATLKLSASRFASRRAALLARMREGGGGVALIPTAPEQIRNRDAHFPYRADSYFHYLTGFDEPEAVLVLVAGEAPQALLFCREKNLEREIWDGFRYGPDAARTTFGFDGAYPIAELDIRLTDLMADQPAVWFSLGHDGHWDSRVTTALNAVRAQTRTGKRAPAAVRDVRAELDAMRLIKDADELILMRRAAQISAAAHVRAMRFARAGCFEYELEAELLHEFRRNACQAPAYTSIVAGGTNACVLHYVGNNQILKDGDLVLIDAGGELDGYAADITRTFPVSGRFSGPQADVYSVVLAAQHAAIEAVRPGASFMAPHEAALDVLVSGMLDLSLLTGSREAVMESESYKRFFMHRTSHWLGRDVHDAGEYKLGEHWQTLQPGMALTIEPGLYVRPADNVPEAFWNIGVRIEDDAVVTVAGCDIITSDAPKSIADIEALMMQSRS